jgi:ubiquinol-cytochrome c reductase cytochrome b subunit
MNKLGFAGAPGTGSFLRGDSLAENDQLVEAAHAAERKALTALREHQDRNGSSNGHTNGSSNGHTNGHH